MTELPPKITWRLERNIPLGEMKQPVDTTVIAKLSFCRTSSRFLRVSFESGIGAGYDRRLRGQNESQSSALPNFSLRVSSTTRRAPLHTKDGGPQKAADVFGMRSSGTLPDFESLFEKRVRPVKAPMGIKLVKQFAHKFQKFDELGDV
jgi:hypothetical protein